DTPLPIGQKQTISQPYIVAAMIALLELPDGARVLEIGTGSGYAAAVCAELAAEVYTVERNAVLAERARQTLEASGYEGVHLRVGDGTRGWSEAAPFDGIMVAAGGPRVPGSLREQLRVGGRMVIPVGEDLRVQRLMVVTRTHVDAWREEDMGAVRFVPLVGEEGFAPESAG
ncbi:MAG: protein-L-isoaspartate(D-aspartate) O-methyltransferase, partial [Myxococcales bacterium]|nr:protein-L-isoaspartate(D-aspartate) O-methyltransferase [Myxococcales bacterium]